MVDQRDLLLEKLASTWHVNVQERLQLGSVQRAEIAKILQSLLRRWGRFPQDRLVVAEDAIGPIYEGAVMTQVDSGCVRITWQRHLANDPSTLAQIRREVYPSVELAVEAFIDSEWPKGIDGIALETD